MRLLALDAATRTGWAASTVPDDQPVFGHVNLSAGLGREPSRGSRFAAARQAYGDLIARFQPEVVLLESPFARGVATTRYLYGLAAIAEMLAHENGAAFLDLEVSAVRRRMLGNGAPADGKATVIRWARGQGFELDDDQDDEADALMLLAVGLRDVRQAPVARRRAA
jgi:Holliday junction resolvasome RuvABC endonuclease subunit